MRFSSDQEFFEQNSKDQQQDPKRTPKKKEKKQTMLSKFLDSLNENVMKKLQTYEKLKRPVFQRRSNVPQKLSLYEDVLFVMIFKQNQQKITSDCKQIKTICIDLQSRTKRKQCTIRQRVQKKLCKMSPQQLLDHVTKDKDISFNLKKVLTSGGKIESEKSIIKNDSQMSGQKLKMQENPIAYSENKMINEQMKSVEKQQDINSLNNSPIKKQDQIFEEKQDNKIEQQKDQVSQAKQENSKDNKLEEINEQEIFIIFKKEDSKDNIFMFNNMLIEKQIMEMKQKQREALQREELMKQFKMQMDVIMHFKKQSSMIPNEIQMLIIEAEKIMKVLGIESVNDVQKSQQNKVGQQKNTVNKAYEKTADKHITEIQAVHTQNHQQIKGNQVSQFDADNIDEQKQQIVEESKAEEISTAYSISYALCQNVEYMKLYNSNPTVFEPLLWTSDEDLLVDKLIQNFGVNERYLNLLIRYKGPQMFIERCIFLRKAVLDTKLIQAIRNCQPLNMNKLTNYVNSLREQMRIRQEEKILDEAINNMPIEC